MATAIKVPSIIQAFAPGGVNNPATVEGAAGTVVQAGSDATGAAKDVVSTSKSVTQFLGMLGNPNVWIRVGEFTLGSLLIIVGLAHLMGVDSAAAKIAKKLPIV